MTRITVGISISRVALLLILSLAAFVQLSVVSRTVVESPLGAADARDYFSYAYNLEHYGVYSSARTWTMPPENPVPTPDNRRPPGYPAFLSLAGSPENTYDYLRRISFLQAGMGIVSVLLAYLIASKFIGRFLGLAVALICAINPFFATMNTYLLTESLFLFLLLTAVLALIHTVRFQRWWLYALTGILWGLCTLVRPTTLFFPVLFLLVVFALPSLRRLAKPALLYLACYLIVLSPWTLRNLTIPSAGPGLMVNTLAHGSYPDFTYDNRPKTFGFPYRYDPNIASKTRDLSSILTHIAGRFRAEPLVYGKWYLFGKPYFFLSTRDVQSFDVLIYPTVTTPYYEDIRFALMRIVSLALHWPLMISGLIGMALLGLRPASFGLDADSVVAARIVALLVLYSIAFHIVAAPFPRYSIPFRPLIFALAGLPVLAAWRAVRSVKVGPDVTI